MLLYFLYSFLRSLNTLPHQRTARRVVGRRARPARQSPARLAYLVVQIVHLCRSKYQQRRCHKERREVLCATNRGTLVYE